MGFFLKELSLRDYSQGIISTRLCPENFLLLSKPDRKRLRPCDSRRFLSVCPTTNRRYLPSHRCCEGPTLRGEFFHPHAEPAMTAFDRYHSNHPRRCSPNETKLNWLQFHRRALPKQTEAFGTLRHVFRRPKTARSK